MRCAPSREPRACHVPACLVLTCMEIRRWSATSNRYARGALRQTYSHVFLDEFQDATKNQYELVTAAFLDTGVVLTAVGDVKQRIMAWAGALDGIMKRFAEDFDAASLPLYQNFRSAPRLRRMQNRMIKQMDPAAASPDKDSSATKAQSRCCTLLAKSRRPRLLPTSSKAGSPKVYRRARSRSSSASSPSR